MLTDELNIYAIHVLIFIFKVIDIWNQLLLLFCHGKLTLQHGQCEYSNRLDN